MGATVETEPTESGRPQEAPSGNEGQQHPDWKRLAGRGAQQMTPEEIEDYQRLQTEALRRQMNAAPSFYDMNQHHGPAPKRRRFLFF